MTVTITVCDKFGELLNRGAVQTSSFRGYQEFNPFYVTLRSAAVTTDNGGAPYLRNANGTYNGNGASQLATGNGYTYQGKALENVMLTYASGVVTMTADDVKWTATGAGFSARSALLCYELPRLSVYTGDRYGASVALAAIDFGTNLSAANNLLFTIKWPAGGIFQWRMA
jgi:hypothetical protein